MGQKVSGMMNRSRFYDAIVCNDIEEVHKILERDESAANMTFAGGKTNALCRAACLGHNEIVELLLRYNGDINAPSADGNTPIMWAAQQNNHQLVHFLLLQHSLEKGKTNAQDFNVLDVAINRMRYRIALDIMANSQLVPKDKQFYEQHQFFEFDVEQFLECLAEKKEIEDVNIFLKEQQNTEDDDDDKVPDPREAWGSWFKRVVQFQKKPMVKRTELPQHLQPHNSLTGKIKCLFHGVNPMPKKRHESVFPAHHHVHDNSEGADFEVRLDSTQKQPSGDLDTQIAE